MAKTPRVDRPITKNLNLPRSVVTQVDVLLYSELEDRVPHGAWSRLLTQLLEAWLAEQRKGLQNG